MSFCVQYLSCLIHISFLVLPKILEKLVRIECQNEQILNLLQHRKDNNTQAILTSLPQLSVTFPLKCAEDIEKLEKKLITWKWIQFNGELHITKLIIFF